MIKIHGRIFIILEFAVANSPLVTRIHAGIFYRSNDKESLRCRHLLPFYHFEVLHAKLHPRNLAI